MSDSSDVLKRSFGTIAERYDAVRPGYPAAVADAILARATQRTPLRVLEIGCGTGQATELFGQRGCDVFATDLSAELVAVASRRLAALPNVRFGATPFEQLNEAERYDVVVSAQAFHWIDPHLGLPKVQRLLRSGGVFGLFWNFVHYDATAEAQRIRDLLLAHVPRFTGWPDSSDAAYYEFAERWTSLMTETPGFVGVEQHHISHTLRYTQEHFVTLLTTFSWFQIAPEPTQRALLSALSDMLPPHGAPLELPVRTLLISTLRSDQL